MDKWSKRVALSLLMIIMVIGTLPGLFIVGEGRAYAADYIGEGAGTSNNPYLIATAGQLNDVRNHLGASFKLIADIDLIDYSDLEGWVPIGSDKDPFSGIMNGNGYKITNLRINRPSQSYQVQGLFGSIVTGSMVTNMSLENVDIIGYYHVGGLAGYNNGIISNSYVTGSVSGYYYVGGLAGWSSGKTDSNSFTTGNVSGTRFVGGLVGYNLGGTISNSYTAGSVSGSSDVGGLAGYNPGTISNSYVTGNVSGSENVGGLAGQNKGVISRSHATGSVSVTNYNVGGLVGLNTETISDSYATGSVTGNYAGGLVGSNDSRGTISNSYAIGNVSGTDSVGGLVGNGNRGTISNSFYNTETSTQSDLTKGDGKLTVEMKLQNTYTDWEWTIWGIDPTLNNGYPYLRASLNYDGNGHTAGNVPVDNSSYGLGVTTSVHGNTGNLTKTGNAFVGWNTLADGSGRNYSGADLLTLAGDTTLYAQWLRVSSNANLRDLSVSSGALNVPFAEGTTDYTQRVSNSVTSLTVTPTVDDATASVTVNGVSTASGQPSAAIALNVGVNTITIIVTAADSSVNTYTIIVTRAVAPAPYSGGAIFDNKVTSTDGKLTLPAGWSGKVSLEDAITIDIPAGATDKELKLTIERIVELQQLLTNKEVLASSIYEILKNLSDNFIKPVTLTFVFNPAKVKSNQRPAVFYYDEVKKVWVEVPGGKISGNTIAVEVDHFTKYAVIVVDQTTGLPVVDETTEPVKDIHLSDIAGHWAEAAIRQAVSSSIVTGYTDGTFKPNHTVTRAEFVVMLMKALQPQEEAAKLTFTDSAKIGAWAQQAVAQAVQAGIINGYGDGTFRPNADITRAEVATIMAKALKLSIESNATTGFTDDKSIPSWARGAAEAMRKLGIMEGRGENQFNPDARATRAEAVTIVWRMLVVNNK